MSSTDTTATTPPNYLTKDAQFHAGTVGNFTGRTTGAGAPLGIVSE